MINCLLVKYKCFMAHCFVMSSPKGDIYERLSYVITNSPINELCTSTIHQGDIAFTNYFGGIGLIIKCPTVIFSSPEDGATYRLENGELRYDPETGTENPEIKIIEKAITGRRRYNEFRVIKYKSIGIFFSTDSHGWPIATQTINNDFKSFYEKTKLFGLPYFFLNQGQLAKVEYDNSQGIFNNAKRINSKDFYIMDINRKAQIMNDHLLTDMTSVVLQNQNPQFLKIEPLRIYRELILALREDDFLGIETNSIYLSAFFSPATNANIKVSLPGNAKIITFDYHRLFDCEKDERIAIILHEYGHAFNPTKKNAEGELAADDFVIERGYGKALKASLEKNIIENSLNFDKEITRQRIVRIN